MKKNSLTKSLALAMGLISFAGNAMAATLYVGSNSSSQTTNFTSGTNVYTLSYVGYNSGDSNNLLQIYNTNTLLTNTSNLYVGFNGSSNSMVISNGGRASESSGYIGNQTNSSSNSVLVTGGSSLWSNSSTLYVGFNGSSNSMVISSGGQVVNLQGYLSLNTSSSNNSVLVTGSGSLWRNTSLYVGYSGPGNSMVISSGGQVVDTQCSLGLNNNSSNNSVLVTGSGSLWSNSSALIVGNSSSGNSLVISNGGHVDNGTGYLGYSRYSSNNSLLVTGSGSLWSNSSTLYVGLSCSGNSLVISNGGQVDCSSSYLGFSSLNLSNNSVLVTGSNSLWSNSSALIVGQGGSGTVTLANGGSVSASGITIANLGGSFGMINIGSFGGSDSAGTIMTPTITFGSGNGQINFNQTDTFKMTSSISGNGYLTQYGSGTTILGSNSYSGLTTVRSGTVLVGDDNSLGSSDVNLAGGKLSLLLGDTNFSFSNLSWNRGAILALPNLSSGVFAVVAENLTLTGQVVPALLDLSGDSLNSATELVSWGNNNSYTANQFGTLGLTNPVSLSISNNALWGSPYDFSGGFTNSGMSVSLGSGTTTLSFLQVGNAPNASSNTVLAVDSNSALNVTGTVVIGAGGSANSLVIGSGSRASFGLLQVDDGSSTNNSVVISDSGTTVNIATNLIVGEDGTGNSLILTNGGTLSVASNTLIGNQSSATSNSVMVTGNASRLSNAGTITIGNSGGGTLTVANGGSVSASGITIAASNNSVGTINIGTLGGSDSAGTITAPTLGFGSGSGTINFNQSDTATLTSSISGLGTLQQLGSGTTILMGNSSYAGTTTVSSGTLLANNTAGSAVGTSSLLITNTGTLGGSGSIGGATRIANGGSLTPGSTGSGELTFTSSLTLETCSTTTFQVNSSSNFTSIHLIGSSLSYGGALVFNLSNYLSAAGDEFTLIKMSGGASPNGNFSSVEALSNQSGFYFAEVSGIWSATNNGFDYQFDPSNGTLLLSLVPEPSTYSLFGLGALTVAVTRRRRGLRQSDK